MVLLQTNRLVKRYGGRAVVDDVSLTVNQGEIVGLLGRNGAGKTTCFRMVIGMVAPNAGRVIFDGVDVTRMPMYKRARRGIGYLSQEPSIFQRLSVRDNLLAILETMPMAVMARKEHCEHLLEQFGLAQVARQLARTLSGGERRKLEIARALVTNPTMILLDEPFSGVDPIAVQDLQHEIRRLRDREFPGRDVRMYEYLLAVDGYRVVDHGLNFPVGQKLPQIVAPWGSDCEDVVDALVCAVVGGNFQGQIFQAFKIEAGETASFRIPLVEVRQLRPQHCRLELIQT